MKRIATLALFALGGALGAGKAVAQDHEVRANIPFDFVVGNSMLPAGSYEITSIFSDVIAIRNSEVGHTVQSLASPDSTQSASRAVLVFQQHDNHYFLCKILGGSSGLNVALPESKLEERARTLDLMASNQSQIPIPASEGN